MEAPATPALEQVAKQLSAEHPIIAVVREEDVTPELERLAESGKEILFRVVSVGGVFLLVAVA